MDAMSAENTEIEDPIAQKARDYFGIDYLYPFQRLVIANVLDGVDQIVVFPTGGGKSLCFQVPSVFLPGITLVVMPLLALIADQSGGLARKGVQVAILKGGQSDAERKSIFEAIALGSVKLVFTTPETLASGLMISELSKIEVSHLVIDEAHCISEWGETFRPSYLELHAVHESLRISVVSAFTATASEIVAEKIKQHLFRSRSVSLVQANPDRPNIFYSVIPALSKSRAVERLVLEKAKPLIVFTRSRKSAERIARGLLRKHVELDVKFYHAGLDASERTDVERWFLASGNGVLVSTCAYGMGVDKANIRTIVHAEIPPSVEAYLQESGRAGRDRGKAEAVLILSDEDSAFLAGLTDATASKRYSRMIDYALSGGRCRREYLLSLLDVSLSEMCPGCDVCASEVALSSEGEHEIISFVKYSQRRYTLRDTVLVLKGQYSYHVRKDHLDAVRGFGMLRTWDPVDIEEAVMRLVSRGRIVIPKKGFWKRRLAIGKTE
jgi:ATP-dependent DNA helicase RecQ